MVICKKCGTENGSSASVCKVCGAELNAKKPKEKKDDIYERFTAADLKAAEDGYSEKKESSKGGRSFFPPRSSDKTRTSVLPLIAAFLKKHWKWLLPGVAIVLVISIIVSAIASIEPDYGLLAISPEYVQFSIADETADGAVPMLGLMDSEGNVVLAAEYQSVLGEVEKDIFAVIGSNAKIGAVNRKGKKVISFDYLSADTEIGFSEDLWAVESSDGWGYINKKGKVKIDFAYVGARAFSDGLAAVFNGEKWGYINKKGDLVIDYLFEDASYFDGGLARVCTDGKYGFINEKGETVIEAEYNLAYPYFDDGLCLVKVGNRYGFINKKGEYAINPQFDDALPFSEGLAAVRLEDKVGYINKDGKYMIDPKFDGTLTKESMFYKGFAVAYKEGTAIVINKDGKPAVGTGFRAGYISHLHDGFFVAYVDGKYGIISSGTCEWVIKPTYENLLLSMRNSVVFEGSKEGVSVFVGGDGGVISEVGSQLHGNSFTSTITLKTVAVAEWCESGNR